MLYRICEGGVAVDMASLNLFPAWLTTEAGISKGDWKPELVNEDDDLECDTE